MSSQAKHTSGFDISMPHDAGAERATIGALLLEKNAIYEVISILRPDMFYDPFLRSVYTAILNVEGRSEIDLVTVAAELRKIEPDGDISQLYDLMDVVTSAAHVLTHALIVLQEYMRRSFMESCIRSLGEANDPSIDVADVIDNHVYSVENLSDNTGVDPAAPIGKIAVEAMKEYENRAKRAEQGESVGIHTGLKKLDQALHGFQRGCVYVLASRPGMGKTAFALNIARKTAKKGNAVLIFSLEMTKRSLIDRMVIAESGVNASDYKLGRLIPDEVYSMGKALEGLSLLPISISDAASITVQQIRAIAKKLKRQKGVDLIIIDYLQLIDMASLNGKSKNDEVAACSRAIKILAKDLDVPVVLLSQLNRDVEKRADKIPMLSDLRDSGAIEQDADAVLFIHRESYYSDDADRNSGLIRVAKNREETTGDVGFWVSDNVTDFRDEKENPF